MKLRASASPSSSETPKHWREYPIRVQPHHTDYAGVVWHGAYLTWMEEARIAALRAVGIEFADLVQGSCDLPVIQLSIDYHRPLTLGQTAVVKSCLHEVERVRLHWLQNIQPSDSDHLCVTARLTLIPFNRTQGRIIRHLPEILRHAIAQLHHCQSGTDTIKTRELGSSVSLERGGKATGTALAAIKNGEDQ